MARSAVSLSNSGKYDEALRDAKRVVEICERILGKDDDWVITSVINLAEVQVQRGQYREAQGLFERALRSYERTFGGDNIKLADVLDRLAVVYYRLGRASDTERVFIRALSIREKVLAAEHPDIAYSIRNLAEFYQFQGNYKKGEPLYQRLLELRRGQGAAQPIADALERYACLLRKTKRLPEAEDMESRALELTWPQGLREEIASAGVVNGTAIKLYQPPYPEEARAQAAAGEVKVRILINESGTVIRACAIEGPQVFMKASESAAYQSKFSPTTAGGKPLRVTGFIIYRFGR